MCVVQAFLHALLDMLSYFLNESLCRLMDIGKFEKLKFSESQCGMCVCLVCSVHVWVQVVLLRTCYASHDHEGDDYFVTRGHKVLRCDNQQSSMGHVITGLLRFNQ